MSINSKRTHGYHYIIRNYQYVIGKSNVQYNVLSLLLHWTLVLGCSGMDQSLLMLCAFGLLACMSIPTGFIVSVSALIQGHLP